jgi:hypothetical protein
MLRLSAALFVASGAVALGATPTSLYKALLAAPVANGTVKTLKLVGAPKRYHAVGQVEVTFDHGASRIVYVVFPTSADNRANFAAGLRSLKTRPGWATTVPAPGVHAPSVLIRAVVNYGTHVTEYAFVSGNVGVNAVTTLSQSRAHALVRLALSHLNAVR